MMDKRTPVFWVVICVLALGGLLVPRGQAAAYFDAPDICPQRVHFTTFAVGPPFIYYAKKATNNKWYYFPANPWDAGFPGPTTNVEEYWPHNFANYLDSSDGNALWQSPSILVSCSKVTIPVVGTLRYQHVLEEFGYVTLTGDCDDNYWAPEGPQGTHCDGASGGSNPNVSTAGEGSDADALDALWTYVSGGGCTPGWDIYVDGVKKCDAQDGAV